MKTFGIACCWLSVAAKFSEHITLAHAILFIGIAAMMWDSRDRIHFWPWGAMFAANLFNGMAILANEGRMPYVGIRPLTVVDFGYHVPITSDSKLLPLCDIFGVGTSINYSVGDVFFAIGATMAIGFWLLNIVRRYHAS